MRMFVRGVVASVSITVFGLGVSTVAVAAPEAGDQRASGSSAQGVAPEVLAALQRDLHLTADQAKARLAQQAKAMEVDSKIEGVVGQAFGGSWFDSRLGKLVVGVTQPQSVASVQAAGAEARVVDHSMAELDAIMDELDALAGKAAGSDKAQRAGGGKRQSAVAGLTTWYVDPTTNSVVVTAASKQAQATALARLDKYGDAVRVEVSAITPVTTANFMDGGDAINGGSCSAGFNLRNSSTGQGYLLTAGHCVTAGTTTTGQGGVAFGPVLESWFPTYDDAIIRNDNPGYWIQGPWVDTNPSNGGVIVVSGYSDSPVGTSICKSGITTKLTCGTITAKDQTVTYSGGATVYGLTRHSACVEPGDSGGANYRVTGNSAEGVTSGAVLYGASRRCGQAVGQPTVSWYFPIADSLAYYGPKYGVTVW
jgi:streptogrisin C